jgi:hypothetical protein
LENVKFYVSFSVPIQMIQSYKLGFLYGCQRAGVTVGVARSNPEKIRKISGWIRPLFDIGFSKNQRKHVWGIGGNWDKRLTKFPSMHRLDLFVRALLYSM